MCSRAAGRAIRRAQSGGRRSRSGACQAASLTATTCYSRIHIHKLLFLVCQKRKKILVKGMMCLPCC
jgi:hypothetical protein